MKRTARVLVSAICLIALIIVAPLLSEAAKDLCDEQGIIVGNQSMLDLWYKKNGGDCTIWNDGHVLMIKPEETLGIFSDMTCENGYCKGNTSYDGLKSFDTNRNCRVRILPGCSPADM